MKTVIIYEDKDIIVVQKPAGLATQTAKIGQPDVVSELKNYLATQKSQNEAQTSQVKARNLQNAQKPDLYLGVVHRLDQPVEGLLVFAKNKAAAANLTRQLANATLNKQYYAVICGQPSEKEGELVDYLIKEDNRARVVTGQQIKLQTKEPTGQSAQHRAGQRAKLQEAPQDAKKAVLQYKILQEISTPEALTLADIHIDTGRFHQIRAQMAHGGMALLGDAKYADTQTVEVGQRLGIRNVVLCAYCLTLKHPVTGKQMSFRIKPEGKAFSYFNCFSFDH